MDKLEPVTFNPEREAAAMDELDRRFLVAVPRQIPAEAHWIAGRAGDPNGSRRFSGFARRNAWMLQRLPSEYGPSWAYRLSADGALIADAVVTRTTQGSSNGG